MRTRRIAAAEAEAVWPRIIGALRSRRQAAAEAAQSREAQATRGAYSKTLKALGKDSARADGGNRSAIELEDAAEAAKLKATLEEHSAPLQAADEEEEAAEKAAEEKKAAAAAAAEEEAEEDDEEEEEAPSPAGGSGGKKRRKAGGKKKKMKAEAKAAAAKRQKAS